MHIALVSNHLHPVKLYGGTERIVEWLAQGLVTQGHKVTLIAKTGSTLPGVTVKHAATADEANSIIPDCDLVHYHGWLPTTEQYPQRYLYTLHGNEPQISSLPEFTACISDNHAKRHNHSYWVYNGIHVDEFEFSAKPLNHLLFFSKIRRRNKGARLAVDLCADRSIPLIMAGGSRADLIKVGAFWRSVFSRVEILGEIGGQAKADAFKQARALIFPIQWQEPFGLVMIESLMSGTPVIAKPEGSVPEIISREVGGLFSSVDEFDLAFEQAKRADRMYCREYAVEHFSSEVMCKTYLSVYTQILDGTPSQKLTGSQRAFS
ncbi:MAG: glycosyltransferase [Litorivicinus sp.]